MKILQINDLHYKVKDTEIIKGISFDVEEGDCISIVGASGSGKSTLLKIISDLIPLSSGSITYRNQDYSKYNPTELRKKISYCVQLPVLFGETVKDNLEFPFKIRKIAVDKNEINSLLSKFNLKEDIVESKIDALSGGEKQRICLIRNLLFTPDIILLDEATASLDERNVKTVEDYIKDLNKKGITVLWITHSMEQSFSFFNKRITIDRGKIMKIEEVDR